MFVQPETDIDKFITYLKAAYPLPKASELSINIHTKETFPGPKGAYGICTRVDKKKHLFKIDVVLSGVEAFATAHEYKHALQWCYEGMDANGSDAKLKGLGYHYRFWEIPANLFAQQTLAEFESIAKPANPTL